MSEDTSWRDTLLVALQERTLNVDEEGPYMQQGINPWGGKIYFTQYSIFRETVTSRYAATMVKVDDPDDCEALHIKLDNGQMSANRYKPMTTAQGLEFIEKMRSKRITGRSYAPDTVCQDANGAMPELYINSEGKLDVKGWIPIAGKESNYSLSNLTPRTDFWSAALDNLNGAIGLVIPCGDREAVTQGDSNVGYVWLPKSGSAWNGMLTDSPPIIKSYTPIFTHVNYNAEQHTLTWQEETYYSYILFNNFAPDGVGDLQPGNVPFFGAGGPYNRLSMFDTGEDSDNTIPWTTTPEP